jgi:rhomboid protease GluP
MLVGYIFYPSLKDAESQISKKTSIIIISVLTLTSVLLICPSISNDLVTYDEKIKEFIALEEEAMLVYHLSDTTSNASVLRIIKNPGMSNWKKCVNLIEDMKRLDLPDEIKERNKLLKFYCRLRIESYRRMHELIKDSTKNVNTDLELEKINKKIEKVINDLGGGEPQ